MKEKKEKKKTSFREERIGDFYKTQHFLLRQWERKISDEILLISLKDILSIKDRQYIIVSRKICKSKIGEDSELIILIKKKKLITCFLQKIEEFQSENKAVVNCTIVSH